MADLHEDKVLSSSGTDLEATASPTLESPHPRDPTVLEYATSRLSTLKPPMNRVDNPFRLLGLLSGKQWLFFLVGFSAWVKLSQPRVPTSRY